MERKGLLVVRIENPRKKDGRDLELNRGYWDMGYFGGKLNRYWTFKKKILEYRGLKFSFFKRIKEVC